MELDIKIPKRLWELLIEEAERRNTTEEKIISAAIIKYIERNGKSNAK